MDLTCQISEDGSSNTKAQAEIITMAIQDESNKVVGAQEEYDPSQPLDSSDEEEHGTLSFEKVTSHEIEVPPEPRVVSLPSSGSKSASSNTVLSKEPDIDLNSIPMPSDEYRRPTIQFSIPTRHRLMSISSLIKRQKGVMKKQDKVGGSGLNYNSEVSKAFHTSDFSGDNANSTPDNDDDERPKISLVQEIFGSDDEENSKDQEDEIVAGTGEVIDTYSQSLTSDSQEDVEIHSTIVQPNEELSKRWITVAETVQESVPEIDTENLNNSVPNDISSLPVIDSEENSQEIIISIKPPSELMEKISNEEDSPELVALDYLLPEPSDSRGKENKQIVLECVSEEDTDFEVTFVGIGKANLIGLRHHGKMNRKNQQEKPLAPKKKSLSPINGFEEGEIIEQMDRKKKKAKKKKSKKRKRSKDSRLSSKMNSERSTADSAEKKSFSENSDSKEVSWKKPKIAKSRNYRNGKRESEEKYSGDRSSKKEDSSSSSYKKGRSPGRHSGAIQSSKSRQNRSLSNGRYRSRSRSGSRDSLNRWENRSRGSKRINKDESHRSSLSNHSSPSHSRSRSLTKRRGKRRHSPSPARKHRNGRSPSRSPHRSSKSPRPRKRNRSSGNEISSKHEKVRDLTSSPIDTQSSKKTSKSKVVEDVSPVEESKKKGRKDKTSSEEVDKEKKKKKRRREKSLSPVKAIVADGDSIVVSLSFQKAKEDVVRTPKVTTSTKNESSSEKDKSNNSNNATDQRSSSERKVSDYVRSSPRKSGTILINLDNSPSQGQDYNRRSPDVIVLDEYKDDLSKKSLEGKKGEDQKSENKSSGSSQRPEGLDFVSSSHDCSADNTRSTNFSAVPEAKATSPAERATSASKSPYKFSEYFVSSTCDVGKTASPALESSSPKRYTPVKSFEPTESSLSQQISHNSSPFHATETPRPSNSTENGPEKASTPSPESSLFAASSKPTPGLPSKPMIGNIPGLFPSGFSSGGGMVSAPIVIPAPPRIIPNTNPTNLLNPNVLVSVASALYAPLLAAKQHQNSSNITGQTGSGALSNLPRHSQPGNALFSKSQSSLNQLFNSRANNGSGDQGEGDSPFSPNSSDGDDLFEPPGDGNNTESSNKKTSGSDSLHQSNNSPAYGKYSNEVSGSEKRNIFDTLFSSAPTKGTHANKHGNKKRNSGHQKKSKQKKGVKRTEQDKNGDGEMSSRLTEEVPTSAVALKMKEKFLKKLNRQERVVEEVKLSLKPHYSKKHITKDEYKDILRKAVPKICHNKSGEINPNKIKELVEAYVKKFRKTRKVENKTA